MGEVVLLVIGQISLEDGRILCQKRIRRAPWEEYQTQGAKRKHGGKEGETEIQAAQWPVAGGSHSPNWTNVPPNWTVTPQNRRMFQRKGRNIPQKRRTLRPNRRNIPPKRRRVHPNGRNIPQNRRTFQRKRRNIPQTRRNIPRLGWNISPDLWNVPPAAEALSPFQERLPQKGETFPLFAGALGLLGESSPRAAETFPRRYGRSSWRDETFGSAGRPQEGVMAATGRCKLIQPFLSRHPGLEVGACSDHPRCRTL